MSIFRTVSIVLLSQLVVAAAWSGEAAAKTDKRTAAAQSAALDEAADQIDQALDEQRYVDAARLLDVAALSGATAPRFQLLAGELNLARGQFAEALASFKKVDNAPGLKARALQGEGVALSRLGKTDAAIVALEAAVQQDANLWRAWNALGGAYDLKRKWDKAGDAYDHAMTASGGAAAVLNNRGYSLLLQGKADAAVTDLVAALRLKPDLAEARTNLRLALAFKGDYDRALSGGAPENDAASLNNVGFAAAMRGDYAQAEEILNRAMKARGDYYARAAANLHFVRELKERSEHAD